MTGKFTALRGNAQAAAWSELLLDGALLWGSLATLAYIIVLLGQMPAWSWYPVFGLALLMTGPAIMRRLHHRPHWSGWCSALLLLCLLAAAVNLFTLRPDADDFSFFHRALVAAQNLAAPLALGDTAHDVAGLPSLSPFHALTSYEVTAALLARLLGLPPLATTILGFASFAAALLPPAYFLLLRVAGHAGWPALVGTAAALAWLLLAGDTHRDWGNFTLLRIWQGKCLLIALHLPLCLLYTLRFLKHGRRADLLRLHLVAISGIGLSGSALFLIPWTAAIASIGYLAASLCRQPGIRRAAAAAAAILLPAGIVALLPALGLLPVLGDTNVWQQGTHDPAALLGTVVTHDTWLYAGLYCLAWLAAPQRLIPAALLLGGGISALLLLVPPIAPLLVDIVLPSAYWRFAYTFPIPFLAGLALAGLTCRLAPSYPPLMRLAALALAVAAILTSLTHKTPALQPGLLVLPQGAKFPRAMLHDAEAIAAHAGSDALVLAPNSIVGLLALLRPDLKFVATRSPETLHLFRNTGRGTAGQARFDLQVALDACRASANADSASLGLTRPVDIVVLSVACRPIPSIEQLAGPGAASVTLDSYRVVLRTGATRR